MHSRNLYCHLPYLRIEIIHAFKNGSTMTNLYLFRMLTSALIVAGSGLLVISAQAGSLEDSWVYKEEVSRFAPSYNLWRYYPVATGEVVCETAYAVGENSREGCVARYRAQAWAAGANPAGSLESRSPWWVDSNHNHVSGAPGQNGLAFINVIAQISPIQTNHAPLDLSGATVAFNVKKDALFDPMAATMRGGGTRKGHLYFWFETAPRLLTNCTPDDAIGENCTRQSDYILSDIEADPASGADVPYQIDSWLTPDVWRRLNYQFTPWAKWTCLGHGENVKYECAPIQEAIRNVTSFGFIVAPVCTAPLPDTPGAFFLCSDNVQTAQANSNQGTIFLDDVTLSRPAVTDVAWVRQVGVSVVDPGNSLRKNASAGSDWNAGAVSAQSLASGSGHVEFTTPEAAMYAAVGLSNGDRDQRPDSIDYSIYLSADGRMYSFESGVAAGYAAPNDVYAPGDRFRIAVISGPDGPTVSYFRNGVALPERYRPAGAPTIHYPLRFDSSFLSLSAAVQDVKISARPRDLASDVAWVAASGDLLIDGNSLTKLANGGEPSGAVSGARITGGNGFVQFTAGETDTYTLLGLNDRDQSTRYDDIAYAIYLYAGSAQVFERGVHKYDLPGTYDPADQFRVAVESVAGSGSVVKYFRNYSEGSAPFYTSLTPPTYPLFADASMTSVGAALRDVVLGGADESVVWSQNSIGVTIGPGSVRKIDVIGWNAGSVSVRALLSGDGYLEFSVPENLFGKRIGLSRGNPGNQPSDIAYQLSFPSAGSNEDIAVAEYISGSQVGPARSFASYMAGDRFRIGVEGGRVTYRRNGVLLYQNPTPLTAADYPLLFNTSLFDTGAAFENVTASGTLGSSGY